MKVLTLTTTLLMIIDFMNAFSQLDSRSVRLYNIDRSRETIQWSTARFPSTTSNSWNTKSSLLCTSNKKNDERKIGNLVRKKLHLWPSLKKFRRFLVCFLTSAFFLFGPIHTTLVENKFLISPVHASTLSTGRDKDLDVIIDNYVRKHMFNEELYDPIESAYRETIADISGTSSYPSTLYSKSSSLLGKRALMKVGESSPRGEGQAMKFVLRLVDTIHTQFGVPQPLIVPGLFLIGAGIPTILILAGLMSFSDNQKAMTERMAVERYGESVLDAEERIVGDEDEDDDFDDVDEDEDDDDDDDEDDEDY